MPVQATRQLKIGAGPAVLAAFDSRGRCVDPQELIGRLQALSTRVGLLAEVIDTVPLHDSGAGRRLRELQRDLRRLKAEIATERRDIQWRLHREALAIEQTTEDLNPRTVLRRRVLLSATREQRRLTRNGLRDLSAALDRVIQHVETLRAQAKVSNTAS